ncbi:MAG: hypothetical protein N2595_07200 [bacterium]|nr:hypothetical protein [bacterium]
MWFGLDRSAFAAPTSERNYSALIERLAERIVTHRMTVPAIVFFESLRPVSRLAGQSVLLAAPLLGFLLSFDTLYQVADMLQDARNVEALIEAIERREAAYHTSRSSPSTPPAVT